jgi:hypothetical protein
LDNTGDYNTAIGFLALRANTTGSFNTATGYIALNLNNGNTNTANGAFALQINQTGSSNTAIGYAALNNNTGGSGNTATGYRALINTTGRHNIALGSRAGSHIGEGENNICIGNEGDRADSNTTRIGTQAIQTATFIAGISGTTVAEGVTVVVDTNGQLGTLTSSERFKEEVKPMDKTSEAILALKPVTFRYKHELDPNGIPQFGLVAEDVAKINPDLVARDENGKPYTVRYEAVNAMLLNEFLKEHRKVEQQRKDFEAALAQQQKQIDALTAGLQEMSAQVELSKAAPRTVLNNP